MNETQELKQIIMDYIKILKEQKPNPEQVQLLHEMTLAYEIFEK